METHCISRSDADANLWLGFRDTIAEQKVIANSSIMDQHLTFQGKKEQWWEFKYLLWNDDWSHYPSSWYNCSMLHTFLS